MKTLQVVLCVLAMLISGRILAADGNMIISHPQCEYRTNPMGLGTITPRFSWELLPVDVNEKGQNQKAYQILAATSQDLLTDESADLWNSGKITSRATNQIVYAGKQLQSRSRVFWKVRVWDQNGKQCGESGGRFSVGLLDESDWKAEWIGHDEVAAAPLDEAMRQELRALPWIRAKTETGRTGQRAIFSREFSVPDGKVTEAWIAGTVDQIGAVKVNGKNVGSLMRWEMVTPLDVRSALKPGANEIEIDVEQEDGFSPAATGMLFVKIDGGAVLRVPLDKNSKCRIVKADGPGAVGEVVEERGRPWGSVRNTEHFMARTPYLRREIAISKPVKQVTLFATALGLYEVQVNGTFPSQDQFAPGWTDYSKRIYHQTYDLTHSFAQGQNVIGITLGDGWYAGLLGYTGRRHWYGGPARFKGQIEIEYADGSREVVTTDASWKTRFGPSLWTDNYMGSAYDSRLEMPGWSKPGFDAKDWVAPQMGTGMRTARQVDVTDKVRGLIKDGKVSVRVGPGPFGDPAYGVVKTLKVEYVVAGASKSVTLKEAEVLELPRPGETGALTVSHATFGEAEQPLGVLQPDPGEGVHTFEEIKAIKVSEPKPGRYVFDLGQNIVGHVRLNITGKPGQKITLRHAEMLNPDGTMYTSNLRGATATDFFWLNGEHQVLEPKFTFHGFQYVEIWGLDSKPDPSMVTGIVVHSQMERSSTFACSNPLVNKLYDNIIWGQKGNYLEVPTDCPQRDERLGWTGDAQFFVSTAAYNFDISSFMSRWLKTLAHDSQFEDGTFAHVAPRVNERGGSTAWGDAAIMCTYAMYERYGDARLVADNYPRMRAYMAWLDSKTKDGITHVGGFGDWLNLNDPTDSDLIDTAYRIMLLEKMEWMAQVADKNEDAAMFEDDYATALQAFRVRFVNTDGSLKNSGQTGYALAFTASLIQDWLVPGAVDGFVKTIENKNWHLATGFIGTPRLLPALHAAGRDDVAYRILLNTDFPSWLYQVKLGATTMWERWDGWTPEKGFNDVGMNSFNHYAFGSVGDYLFKVVAGIDADGAANGEFRLHPVPGAGLDFARASYRGIGGTISTSWERTPSGIEYNITVPPNCRAMLELPGKQGESPAQHSLDPGKHKFIVPN